MDEKLVVKNYFNTTGFERWRKIYGDAQVNRVQRDIREGHARTVETVLEWLDTVTDQRICDAGCGVGSLSIPLAQRGARV
ncbi:MAG: magnesium protoporphyrin IX methyltransferase, partial [Cyanobacteria bacterium J06648_11]